MFLIMQLNLTCRKDRVRSPTREECCDLLQRTSDDCLAMPFKKIYEIKHTIDVQSKDSIRKRESTMMRRYSKWPDTLFQWCILH